jgi:hypothetical protein
MELTHRPFLRTRGADRALTGLVVFILLEIAVFGPLAATGAMNRHLNELVAALVVGAGAFAVWTHLAPARVLAVVTVALTAVRLSNFWLPDSSLRFADACLALAGYLLLSGLVARQVVASPGRMNWHRVIGAVAIYLLVGLAFTQGFRLVAMHVGTAFLVQGQPVAYDAIVGSLNYFSFVTLGTLGYGDIVPAHPAARGLALVESLFGVMYPVLVISWLVSREVEAEREARRD